MTRKINTFKLDAMKNLLNLLKKYLKLFRRETIFNSMNFFIIYFNNKKLASSLMKKIFEKLIIGRQYNGNVVTLYIFIIYQDK